MMAFFCSGGSSQKKLHLVNWNTLILPKGNGGLGIKDPTLHNQAFLFKWLWRLNHHSDSLWVQLLKAKYSFQTECGLYFGNNISPIQSNIQCSVRSNGPNFSILENIRIAIGNGLNVRFWHDKWFGILALKFSFNRLFNLSTHHNAFVCEMGAWENDIQICKLLWYRSLLEWELLLLTQMLTAIININLSCSNNDRLVQEPVNNGISTVKSLQRCLLASSCDLKLVCLLHGQVLLPLKWKPKYG